MSLIVVSIINYRTGAMTIAAVQSVLSDLGERNARVVIVDNQSNDGSGEAIQSWIAGQNDPRLIFIQSATNCGFSGGHNQGMQAVPDADSYLILNSDSLLRPGFFDALLPTLGDAGNVGLVAPQLVGEDDTPQISCFRFASPLSEVIRGASTGHVTRLFEKFDVSLPHPPLDGTIEWASFACILLDGKMVRSIGPMDEGYFLYFEDEEYALRAQKSGWGVVYQPAARAVHFRGGSGPVKSLQKAKKRLPDYYWRARTRFLRQAHGPLGPVLANVCWVLGRTVAQARRLAGRDVPPSHEAEWRDIWLGVWNPLKPDHRSQR